MASRTGHFLSSIKSGMMSFWDNKNKKVIIKQNFKIKRSIISMIIVAKIIQKVCKVLSKLNQSFKEQKIRIKIRIMARLTETIKYYNK